MNFLDFSVTYAETPGRIYGVVIGIVTNNQDPENLGRVKVKFPWLSDSDESYWARLASPMAGKSRGVYFLPEVEDEVLVVFEQGDMRFPYILGALWNGKDPPPVNNSDGKNHLRVIHSRSGHILRFNDEPDKETIEIIDKSGKNSITIDTAKNTLTITAEKDIVLRAPNGTIELEAKTLKVKAKEAAEIEAKEITLKAQSNMTLKGQTINLN
ncbi:MAG: hypothetical protein N5P05_004394 (plasmid) [Chroococcopsis gigantea SAG 12.99]|jgi:uncharacterized protein involved in type VI secretion and phage assembly|nr:hypothetical protein [Chroococcopsis gigantea SAG 12.99]